MVSKSNFCINWRTSSYSQSTLSRKCCAEVSVWVILLCISHHCEIHLIFSASKTAAELRTRSKSKLIKLLYRDSKHTWPVKHCRREMLHSCLQESRENGSKFKQLLSPWNTLFKESCIYPGDFLMEIKAMQALVYQITAHMRVESQIPKVLSNSFFYKLSHWSQLTKKC